MNTRILTVLATAALLCTTVGCSGMRNFMFGRGARCGLCNDARGTLRNLNPLARQNQVQSGPLAQAPPLIGGRCRSRNVTPPANNYGPQVKSGGEAVCGVEAGCGMEQAPVACNSCPPYGAAMGNYDSTMADPYLNGDGQIIDGQIIDGQIIDGQIIDGGNVIGGGVVNGQAIDSSGAWLPRGDSSVYSANKYDQDGHRIISEDPLPPGAVPAN